MGYFGYSLPPIVPPPHHSVRNDGHAFDSMETGQRPRFRYRGWQAASALAFDRVRCDWCGDDSSPAYRLPVRVLEGSGQSCARCGSDKDLALEKARHLVPEFFPRGGRLATVKQVRAFHLALFEIGDELQGSIGLHRVEPRKVRRPPKIAEPFALCFLFLQGVSDARIAEAIGISTDSVKKRRTRSKLFRTDASGREYEARARPRIFRSGLPSPRAPKYRPLDRITVPSRAHFRLLRFRKDEGAARRLS